MTVEASIFTALTSLVSGRVYRDVAPANVTTLPRITFQQAGGEAVNFLTNSDPAGIRNARVQVNVWHSSRDAANALAIQVEEAMRGATALQATVLGSFVAVYEEDTNLFGTMQDFSCWTA